MALDIDKVEAILRQHWQIPSDLSRAKLQEHAGRIHVLRKAKADPSN